MTEKHDETDPRSDADVLREALRASEYLIPTTAEGVARFEGDLARNPVVLPAHLQDPEWLPGASANVRHLAAPRPAPRALHAWLVGVSSAVGGAAAALLMAYLCGWLGTARNDVQGPQVVFVREFWQPMPVVESLMAANSATMPPAEGEMMLAPPSDDGAPSGPGAEWLETDASSD